ncbi:dsRNA-binding protein 2 [Prunus dulcis]|uniref:DsRNA-binding protein 2 n=1 Tax=Prunus dulcis TaxID=3755 RepID=A0A4Y1RNW4_PRUDU|nr:dsRNA-binding protein 2 [Prunus dulcis]
MRAVPWEEVGVAKIHDHEGWTGSQPCLQGLCICKWLSPLTRPLLANLPNKRRTKPPCLLSSTSPLHLLLFLLPTVTADHEHTIESPEFFNTLKGPEHAAANAVSMSSSQDGAQTSAKYRVESGHCKNLLQELAQREGFYMPQYKTARSGASHLPTFSSTVEVEGEEFYGKAGKSKKQAELNAAKVAYIALKERGLSRATEITSCHLKEGALKTTQSSDLRMIVDSVKNLIHEEQLVSSPAIKYEECTKQMKGTLHDLSANANLEAEVCDSFQAVLEMDNIKETGNPSSCSESMFLQLKKALPCQHLYNPIFLLSQITSLLRLRPTGAHGFRKLWSFRGGWLRSFRGGWLRSFLGGWLRSFLGGWLRSFLGGWLWASVVGVFDTFVSTAGAIILGSLTERTLFSNLAEMPLGSQFEGIGNSLRKRSHLLSPSGRSPSTLTYRAEVTWIFRFSFLYPVTINQRQSNILPSIPKHREQENQLKTSHTGSNHEWNRKSDHFVT